MSEIQLKATNVEDKPVRIGDLPIVKTNILENAGQMDKGVVGGYNGAFPLTAASEGGIYLLPSTGKFYVCETAYNGVQISAPNSNFVELSVWKNHDRLANLVETIVDGDIIYKKFIDGTMIVSGFYSCNGTSMLSLKYSFSNNKYYMSTVTNSNNGNSLAQVGITVDINTSSQIRFVSPTFVSFTFVAVGNWK